MAKFKMNEMKEFIILIPDKQYEETFDKIVEDIVKIFEDNYNTAQTCFNSWFTSAYDNHS